MAFLKEDEPERGACLPVLPGVFRIVANNPGLMTYHGTNTYLIESKDGFIVIDPGPDDHGHIEDILRATAGAVSTILLSHTHFDHLGATAALKARTGARTYAFHLSGDPAFSPDVPLRDGDQAAGMTAVHTPGHASDHLCFAWHDGIVFSADHIMSWSSSIVSPPGGDMADYIRSLQLMIDRDDRFYLPGHGPWLANPRPYVQQLLDHRVRREEAIAAALRSRPLRTWDLVDMLYSKADDLLLRAAERNVTAHLLKLRAEGRAINVGDQWSSSE